MTLTHRRNGRTSPSRRGFTLIELLGVILIISILIALLFPALGAARTTARIAQVKTEMAGLETALNDFKATFGEYPPSRITLYENDTDWTGTESEKVRSRGILRQFWPQINFAIDRDFNLDGDSSDTIELVGPECLVFFLGGMQRSATANNDFIGFSKNPSDPFNRSGTNRKGPFFEFQPSRLVSSTHNTGGQLKMYVDTLPNQTQPYLYASSYEGRGYQAADINDWMTNGPYRATGGSYWNAKSFQLISAGIDNQHGPGGTFVAETADDDLSTAAGRAAERDNITNFHGSMLTRN